MKDLPSFSALLERATGLYKAYATAKGYTNAMVEVDESSSWAKTVPIGTPWVPPVVSQSSLESSSVKAKAPKTKTKTAPKKSTKATPKKITTKPPATQNIVVDPPPEPIPRDEVLGQSVCFVRDALVSKKLAMSVAEGDVGCIYECSKVRKSCDVILAENDADFILAAHALHVRRLWTLTLYWLYTGDYMQPRARIKPRIEECAASHSRYEPLRTPWSQQRVRLCQ